MATGLVKDPVSGLLLATWRGWLGSELLPLGADAEEHEWTWPGSAKQRAGGGEVTGGRGVAPTGEAKPAGSPAAAAGRASAPGQLDGDFGQALAPGHEEAAAARVTWQKRQVSSSSREASCPQLPGTAGRGAGQPHPGPCHFS